jgi:ATP-dependent Lon protease
VCLQVARALVQEYITTFIRHKRAFDQKPLVLLLPGPPGHGKTWSARNIARALSSDDDSFLEVAMGAVNDKADLFGGSPFGGGADVVRGSLCGFLHDRAGKLSVVLLDEIEKCLFDTDSKGELAMKTNTGGWCVNPPVSIHSSAPTLHDRTVECRVSVCGVVPAFV